MVTRRRLRSVLTTLGLYVAAALLIGYFGVNAYTGNHGLRAQKDLDQQIAQSSVELAALKAERANWERRVSLAQDPTASTPTCSTSGHARCSTMSTRATSCCTRSGPDGRRRTSRFPLKSAIALAHPLRVRRLRFRPRMISAKGWMSQ